jgi:hypothetical protein
VDFVVFGEAGLYALEVKSRGKVQAADVAGLKAFKRDYPEAKVALLSPTPAVKKIDDIPCLDLGRFLLGIRPEKALPGFE